MNKKGEQEKYYIVISMILGIIVVGLVMFFLFHEYFTEDDVEWEACRQSIVLRHLSPEVKAVGIVWDEFKTSFPLKCKTETINIDYFDIKNPKLSVLRAEKEIADALVSCWSLFGNGKYRVFPENTVGTNTYCVPCARITIDEKVKKYYIENYKDEKGNIIDTRINFERMLIENKINKEDTTYYNYLQTIGGTDTRNKDKTGTVEAFIGRISFDRSLSNLYLSKGGERIDPPKQKKKLIWDTGFEVFDSLYPKYYNVDNPLIISIGQFTYEKDIWATHLFFYYGNTDTNLYTRDDVFGASIRGAKLCENWDGIPA